MNLVLGDEDKTEQKTFMTVDEAAAELGISSKAVALYCAQGKLTKYKQGKGVLVDAAEVAIAKELRARHSRNSWHLYASWYDGAKDTATDEVEETTEEANQSLAQKFLALAKELRDDGDYVTACKIQDVVLGHYDFSS